MRKFKITTVKIQNGKQLGNENSYIIETESWNIPKVGDGKDYLVDPPIREKIISVEEISF